MFPTQKTINYGGKQTGKIIGGMYFVENTEETDLSTGVFMSIGSGFAAHVPFQLTIPYTVGDDFYFDIIGGNITATQKLRYFKGKNTTTLTLKWSITLESVEQFVGFEDEIVNLKVLKTNINSVTTTISDTLCTISSSEFGIRSNGISIVDLYVGDSFFIQIEQPDGINVIVSSAEIIFVE